MCDIFKAHGYPKNQSGYSSEFSVFWLTPKIYLLSRVGALNDTGVDNDSTKATSCPEFRPVAFSPLLNTSRNTILTANRMLEIMYGPKVQS